jgi:dolichol-phosphate mannosyltransferase
MGRVPRLRVAVHAQAAGQSAALWTGIAASRAALVATLDGDGQNDPADLPALIALAREAQARGESALIAGQRVTRRDSAIKRASSRIANAIRAAALGDRTPDTGCGIKVFPRALYLSLPRFDHMHRFLPALVLREGASVIRCPVNHRPRRAGRSKYGTLHRAAVGIVDLLGVMWLKRRRIAPALKRAP